MSVNGRMRRYECVVVDLNTQSDFCTPAGAHPVANLDVLIPALRHVMAWTKRNGAPLVSSLESHRPADYLESRPPVCCLDGTLGQRKLDFTILQPSTYVEVDNTLSCPVDLFSRCQQVIFCKRTCDLLNNPKADRFFNLVGAAEFILSGVAVEDSVKALALGLLAREKRVSILVDACGFWSAPIADLALRQLVAKGATLLTVSELLGRRLSPRCRYTRARGSAVISRNGAGTDGATRRNGHAGAHTRFHPPSAAPRAVNEPPRQK